MSRMMEFEVRGAGVVSPDAVERMLHQEVEREQQLRVRSATRDDGMGMTAGDIAISFVVSVLGSAAAPVLRDHVDAAVRTVSAATGARLRLLFPATDADGPDEGWSDEMAGGAPDREMLRIRDALTDRRGRGEQG